VVIQSHVFYFRGEGLLACTIFSALMIAIESLYRNGIQLAYSTKMLYPDHMLIVLIMGQQT